MEDGTLLDLLGPQTEEERRYVAEEPKARERAWADWMRNDLPKIEQRLRGTDEPER